MKGDLSLDASRPMVAKPWDSNTLENSEISNFMCVLNAKANHQNISNFKNDFELVDLSQAVPLKIRSEFICESLWQLESKIKKSSHDGLSALVWLVLFFPSSPLFVALERLFEHFTHNHFVPDALMLDKATYLDKNKPSKDVRYLPHCRLIQVGTTCRKLFAGCF